MGHAWVVHKSDAMDARRSQSMRKSCADKAPGSGLASFRYFLEKAQAVLPILAGIKHLIHQRFQKMYAQPPRHAMFEVEIEVGRRQRERIERLAAVAHLALHLPPGEPQINMDNVAFRIAKCVFDYVRDHFFQHQIKIKCCPCLNAMLRAKSIDRIAQPRNFG